MAKSPEAAYRIGSCTASVFLNEANGPGGKRKFRSVALQRSYRDGDETKYSTSFTLGDLPSAIRVLQLAQQHVEDKEAESTP